MRAWQVFGVVVVVCAMSVSSFAGKNKDPATTAAADPTQDAVEMEIKSTGAADVDAVFTKADAPLGTVKSVRGHLSDMRIHLTTALALSEGTPIADALADLDQKAGDTIMVAVDTKGMPQLKASDAVPANVQSAIDAFNSGMGDIEKSAENLADIPAQLEEVITAAGALNADSLTKSGVPATGIPKAVKTVDHNVKVLKSAKTEAEGILVELAGVKSSVQTLFKSM
jgi:hypothetical protein